MMSVTGMVRSGQRVAVSTLVVQPEVAISRAFDPVLPRTLPRARTAARTGALPQQDDYLERVARFIPSEVLAVYVPVVAILDLRGDVGRWAVFGCALALIPLILWLRSSAEQPLGRERALAIWLIGTIAFVAWAAAIPSGPFQTFTEDATRFGGAAVIVVSVLLPLFAAKFRVA